MSIFFFAILGQFESVMGTSEHQKTVDTVR
jgi:hypothetical protein